MVIIRSLCRFIKCGTVPGWLAGYGRTLSSYTQGESNYKSQNMYRIPLIPQLRSNLWKAGRLAGPFGYSNTYALFLLVGLLVQSAGINQDKNREKKRMDKIIDLFLLLILLVGLILTKSRAVIGIAIAYYTAWGFCLHVKGRKSNKKKIEDMIPVSIALFLTVLVIMMLLGILMAGSTFWGRLLYVRDMFPAILSHPLGTG